VKSPQKAEKNDDHKGSEKAQKEFQVF